MITLQENERLVQAGTVSLRAPDGTLLPAVPQYIIVSAEDADPAAVVEVGENERLVVAGQVLSDRKRAEERYAALLAGRDPGPKERGTPLYFIESTDGINPETGLSRRDEAELDLLAIKYAEIFVRQEIEDRPD